MRINTNVSSLVAQEASVNTSKNLAVSLEKLSSGLRINKASDDASGLAIADKLRTQATSINQGIANGNSAVTLLQIADKSMSEQSSILDTIKSKLIQANTDTTSADGRESIRKDIKKLLEQLDNIAEQTNYNGNVLLQKSSKDQGKSNSLAFQIGETNRDIIANSAIQSNSAGLGSKIDYASGSEIAQKSTVTLTTTSGAITVKGTDSSNTNTIENVTLSGSVDKFTLTAGMTITNANADAKTTLDAAVTSGKLSKSGETYTVTDAGRNQDITFASNSIEATVAISTTGNAGTTFDISSGQIIDTNTTGGISTGSDLETALADVSKFTETATGSGIYVANKTISNLAIDNGDEIKITTTPKEVVGGGTDFDFGDTIEAIDVTTGSMLDNALKNTSMFKNNGDNTYTVLDNFTAGKLLLMDNESIKVTGGSAPSFTTTALVSGDFTITGKIGTLDVVSASGDPKKVVAAGSGTDVFAGPNDVLKFDVTAVATGVFAVDKNDIIQFTDADATDGATANELSRDVLESGKFLYLGGDRYQAKESVNLHLTAADTLKVEKTFTSGTETTFNGNGSTTSIGAGSADADISFTTKGKVNVTNNDTTSGNKLVIEGTNISNGEMQLSSLASVVEGGLTKDLSDSFQGVVDNAITKLNGYRGDIGSTQNQVESAVRNLMTQATNVKAAESIIRDVDYAAESANFNKQNIISQAGSYAISQSNAVQQNVLRLLQ